MKRWGYYVVGSLDVISVTGFKIGDDGQLHMASSRQQKEIGELARSSGVQVFPLVTFTSSSDGRKVLTSADSRKRAIAEIAALVRSADYGGVHLDLEYLPPEDAPKLADFLRELRPELGGKILSMAIFPPFDFPEKWSGFHCLDLIGPLLDEIVLMAYDFHRPGTPPGPVVNLGWVERNVAEVLKSMQPEKVWLGTPAYGYEWSDDGRTKVVSARDGVRLAKDHNAIRHESGTLYFQLAGRDGMREVYVADAETRRRMEELARSHRLKGVALWRLGFEE
jgi:spore germination protein YaaH